MGFQRTSILGEGAAFGACSLPCQKPQRSFGLPKQYKERHDYVVSELNQINGIECRPTDGTFYVFPSFKNYIEKSEIVSNDKELALYILEKSKVAVVPGSAFGIEGHIRISIAIDIDSLKNAMERLKNTLTL